MSKKGTNQEHNINRRVAMTTNHTYQVSAAIASMISNDPAFGQKASSSKKENDEAMAERIEELNETLNEKKNQFHSLSKDFESTQQDYQTNLTYLKELKASSNMKLKVYVQTVTQTALKDSDLNFKEHALQRQSELSSGLLEGEFLALHNLRHALDEAMRIYGDCRKNLKSYQAKVSAVTSEARIEALNVVAFCRYAQSTVAAELGKLPAQGLSLGQGSWDRTRANSSRRLSAQEMRRIYLERIARLRREEALLSARLAAARSASSSVDYASPSPSPPRSLRAAAAPPQGSGRAVPSPLSAEEQGDSDGDDQEGQGEGGQNSGAATSFLPPVHSPRAAPVAPRKRAGKKRARAVGPGERPAAIDLFDRERFSAALFAACGVRVDGEDLTGAAAAGFRRPPLRSNPSLPVPRSVSEDAAGPPHSLQPNALLLPRGDGRAEQGDRGLAQLALLACALEGQHRQLLCVREGLDEHLLRLSYLFLTLSEDLHEHLAYPAKDLRHGAASAAAAASAEQEQSSAARCWCPVDLSRDVGEMQRESRESEQVRAGLGYQTRLLLKLHRFSTII